MYGAEVNALVHFQPFRPPSTSARRSTLQSSQGGFSPIRSAGTKPRASHGSCRRVVGNKFPVCGLRSASVAGRLGMLDLSERVDDARVRSDRRGACRHTAHLRCPPRVPSWIIVERTPHFTRVERDEIAMVTFVDSDKIRSKRDPGRCFLRAGFENAGETVGGLVALVLRSARVPEPMAPASETADLFEVFGR